jgi:hypothetical protein
MATLTANIVDWQGSPRPGLFPRLVFEPRRPAGQDANVFITNPLRFTPDNAGAVSAVLIDSYSTFPSAEYDVFVEWVNGANVPVARDRLTTPERPLVVPVGGGKLGDLLKFPANPSLSYKNLTPPDNPSPGVWWLETNPDNFDDPANTEFLYEWEN